MKKVSVLATFLLGCTNNVPKVIAVTGEPELGRDAIEAWSSLGFTYTDDARDADITVNVKIATFITSDCNCAALGHADGLTVWIDPELHGDAQRHTARHEFGHVLLQSIHLESYPDMSYSVPGGFGIMNASPYRDGVPTWLLEPTPDDYALACYTTGLGC